MVLVILVGCIVLVMLLSQRLHSTVLSPWAIYASAWLGMFFLYFLNWVTFIPVAIETWGLLIGSLLSYGLGASIVLLAFSRKAKMVMEPPEKWFAGVDLSRYSKFQVLLTLAGIIGAIGYFIVIERLFGLETLVTDPGLIRSSQDSDVYIEAFFWWKFFFYMNWLAVPVAVARIAFQRRRTPRWVFLTLAFHLAINLTLVTRGQVLLVLVLAVSVLVMAYHESLRRREILLIGGVIIITAIYFVLVGEALGKTYDYIVSEAGGFYGPEFLRPLAGFYSYITGNLPAFQAFVYENADSHTFGLFQFLPVFKVIKSLNLISTDLPNEVGDFLLIPFRFNTFTYLNVFYKDWGIWGILFGPCIFGFLSNWLYLRTCNNGRVWHVIASAFVIHACLISISTSDLIRAPQWEFALVLVVLGIVSQKTMRRTAIPVFKPIS